MHTHTDTSNFPQMCRMSIHFQQKYSRKPHTRAHPQIKGNVIFITIFIDYYGQLRVGRIDKSARLSASHQFTCFAYALLSHSSTVTATTMAVASVVTTIARTCGFRLCKCRELLWSANRQNGYEMTSVRVYLRQKRLFGRRRRMLGWLVGWLMVYYI